MPSESQEHAGAQSDTHMNFSGQCASLLSLPVNDLDITIHIYIRSYGCHSLFDFSDKQAKA